MDNGLRIYFDNVIKRYDDDGIIPYFSLEEFDGLVREKFDFSNSRGISLKGFIYSYGAPREDRVVIFAHGLGGGHLSYFREIERMCAEGFRVITYDVGGCFESGGENIHSMTEFASDLGECIAYVEKRYKGTKISLVGHSAGGYAVGMNMNAGENVDRGVILSGFSSVSDFLGHFVPPEAVDAAIGYERTEGAELFGKYAADEVEKSRKPVLIIQSEDDATVPVSIGIDVFEKKCTGGCVRTVRVNGKGHNPNFNADALKYMNDTFGEYMALTKNGTLKTNAEKHSYMAQKDLLRMTEQDENVWEMIFGFLG